MASSTTNDILMQIVLTIVSSFLFWHTRHIFDALNNLNLQMQGGGVQIIETEKHLKAFQKENSTMETTN